MVVDARKPRCPGQTLVGLERNVVLGARIPILLGEPIVDDVENPRLVAQSDEKVFCLDVAVNEMARMEKPQALDGLHGNHQDVAQT